MKAALYTRVSTIEQAKEGNSLKAQSEALIEYAKKSGHDIFDTYEDDGASAASLNRPALQRLIRDIKDRRIEIVLIHKQDRLSRRVKDIIELVELFIEYDIKLHSLSETIDWLSSSGRAMLKMMATFSEMERENITERSKMGRDFKARQGLYSNRKNLPIGYQWDNEKKELIPLPGEDEQVRKIFELYLLGWSMRKISRYMAENYKNRYGSYNHRLAAKRTLYNPIYAGYMKHNGELIKAKNVTPLLDLETYLKAEKQREENRKQKIKADSPYLLVGLLRCGLCGQRYSSKRYDRSNAKKVYLYHRYACDARQRFDPQYHAARCTDSPIIDSAELDERVLSYIEDAEIVGVGKETHSAAIDTLMSDNSAAREKINKLVDLYESDVLDLSALEKRISVHTAKIKDNDRMIKLLLEEIKNQPAMNVQLVQEKIKNIKSFPHSEKRSLLRALIEMITIFPDRIDIKLRAQYKKP